MSVYFWFFAHLYSILLYIILKKFFIGNILYLSKLTLNGDKPSENYHYRMHQLVWKVFLPKPDIQRNFLYHINRNEKITQLYVVSCDIPIQNTIFHTETKLFEPKLKIGQRLQFSLTANPVIQKKGANTKRRKHDLWMHSKLGVPDLSPTEQTQHCKKQVKEWLVNQSQNLGFSLNMKNFDIIDYQLHELKKEKVSIRFSAIDYIGKLIVTNPNVFYDCLYTGIGKSRAFGCGLLLIRHL